jgi:hypothetical protein
VWYIKENKEQTAKREYQIKNAKGTIQRYNIRKEKDKQ